MFWRRFFIEMMFGNEFACMVTPDGGLGEYNRAPQNITSQNIGQENEKNPAYAIYLVAMGKLNEAATLLGEMLLAQGRPQEAITVFELSLLRNTNRSLALLGLARAQEAAGNLEAAAETQALLASNWKGDLPAFRQSTYPWLGD